MSYLSEVSVNDKVFNQSNMLNETDVDGNPVNYWYQLGYDNGYTDIFYTQTSTDPYGGETVTQDWCWVDENGVQVAYSEGIELGDIGG